MDKIDQQYLNEIVGGTEPGELDTQHDLKVHEENTTIEELEVHCTVKMTELTNFTHYHIYNVCSGVFFPLVSCLWLSLFRNTQTPFSPGSW